MAPLVLPDGRRPAGALEGGRAARRWRTRLRWAAGVGRGRRVVTACWRGRHRRRRGVGLLLAFWIVASVVTDLVERLRPAGGLRTACAPGAPAAAVDRRHAARAPRHRRLRRRRHAGADGRDRARRPHAARRQRRRSAATRSRFARRRATSTGRTTAPTRGTFEVTANGRPGRDAASREAPLSGAAQTTMTEAAIDAGLHARPLRVARRAGRRTAPGSCASTSSRSSTGSGAAA